MEKILNIVKKVMEKRFGIIKRELTLIKKVIISKL